MSRSPFRYVPALDGVRALSVVAILLFHSGFQWVRGGFLGVSVFFTLSGFLITSLLLSERERTGRISLKDFWVRRARRLAPAILVLFALVATLLATGNLAKKSSTFGDAVATAGWGANWRFILSGESYEDVFSQPSPFQHMWSLAVEEQFYLFFPGLLLLLLGRKAAKARRWAAIPFVVAGIATSTYLLWHLFDPVAEQRAYFGTDTRMAEPFVGVLLALLLIRGGGVRALPRAARRLLDLAALGALGGLAYLTYSWGQYDEQLYHGGLLLVAGLSAVLLAGVSQPGSLLGRVLGLWPLAWLGRVSYGVYVFHWPVYLWLTPKRTGLEAYPLLGLRIAVVLAIAGVSFYLVEQPIRRAKGFRVTVAIPAWANATVAAMAVLVVATGTVVAAPSTPRPTDAVSASALGKTKHAPPKPVATSGKKVPTKPTLGPTQAPQKPRTQTSRPRTGVAQPTRPTQGPTQAPRPSATPAPKLKIAVVGDSMANDLGFGMEAWASGSRTVVAKNFAVGGCPMALDGIRRYPDGDIIDVRGACYWYTNNSQRWKDFTAFDPDVVIIQAGLNEFLERKLDSWNAWHKAGDPMFDEWFVEQYRQMIDIFNPDGRRTLLLLNATCADWDNVGGEGGHYQGFQLELDRRVDALNADFDQLAAVGLQHVDLKAHLCPNGQYTDDVDGVEGGRYDGYHLTNEASVALATKWLGPLSVDAAKQ